DVLAALAQGLHDAVDAVARHAEDHVDVPIAERVDKDVCCCRCHANSLCRDGLIPGGGRADVEDRRARCRQATCHASEPAGGCWTGFCTAPAIFPPRTVPMPTTSASRAVALAIGFSLPV